MLCQEHEASPRLQADGSRGAVSLPSHMLATLSDEKTLGQHVSKLEQYISEQKILALLFADQVPLWIKAGSEEDLFADFERTPTSQAALRQVLTSPRQAVLRAGESGHYYGCSATRLCRRPGPEAFMTLYISKVWYSFVPGQLRVLIEQQWPGLQALELLRVRIFTRFRDVWGLGFKLSVVAFGG